MCSVTDKVATFLDEQKKNEARLRQQKKTNESSGADSSRQEALQQLRWTLVKLSDRKEVSPDTRKYTFQLPQDKPILGLKNGQHLELGLHMQDKMLIRQYTPTRPTLPSMEANSENGRSSISAQDLHDGRSSFDLITKNYFPDQDQPGGAMSNILDTISIGEQVDIRGPTGDIIYNGHGNFTIKGKERHVRRVCPWSWATLASHQGSQSSVEIFAHTTTKLRYESLTRISPKAIHCFAENLKSYNVRVRVVCDTLMSLLIQRRAGRVLGLKGLFTKDMVEHHLLPRSNDSIALVCGPPPKIRNAVIPGLAELGFVEDETIFGF